MGQVGFAVERLRASPYCEDCSTRWRVRYLAQRVHWVRGSSPSRRQRVNRTGVSNPHAWLLTAARNRLLDRAP
jgi:hypothetical protein